ncbi:MAG: hypothetical protein IJ141_08635, partial [Lachnospiraceae bacterium]|nr:hypothetical protein [Lachnospiraceae bacterium]
STAKNKNAGMQVYLQMPAFFVFHSAKHFTEPKRSEGEVVCSGYYSEAKAKWRCLQFTRCVLYLFML